MFVNTVLGECYRVKGEAPPWQTLYDRREEWRGVPPGVLFLTIGIDVQKDRVEAFVWGWGRGRESWLVEKLVAMGSPWTREPWVALSTFIARSWETDTGIALKPVKVAIDSGFATTEVAAWSRRYPRSWVIPVKGASNLRAPPLSSPAAIDVVKPGQKKRRGLKVWPVGTHVLKQELYGLLALPKPTDEVLGAGGCYPPGYVHLSKHADADEEVCKQLVGEEWDQQAGRWREVHAVEALDCWIYARAAAIAAGIEKMREPDWRELEASVGSGAAEKPPPAAPQQREDKTTTPPSPGGVAVSRGAGRAGGRRVLRNSLAR